MNERAVQRRLVRFAHQRKSRPRYHDVILRRLYRFGFADGGSRRDVKRTKSLLLGHDLAHLYTRTRADMHLIRLVKIDRELKLLPRSLRRHARTRADMQMLGLHLLRLQAIMQTLWRRLLDGNLDHNANRRITKR